MLASRSVRIFSTAACWSADRSRSCRLRTRSDITPPWCCSRWSWPSASSTPCGLGGGAGGGAAEAATDATGAAGAVGGGAEGAMIADGGGGNVEALPVAVSPPQAASAREASAGGRNERRRRIEVIEFSFVIELG